MLNFANISKFNNCVFKGMQQVLTGPTLTAMPGMQPVFLPTPGMDGQAQPNAIPSHIDCVGYPLSESPQENSKRREHDSFHEYRRTPERWQNDYEERDRRRMRDNRDRFDGDSRNEIRNYYNRRNDETYHRDRDKDQYEEQRQKNEKGVPQERESVREDYLLHIKPLCVYIFNIMTLRCFCFRVKTKATKRNYLSHLVQSRISLKIPKMITIHTSKKRLSR